MIPSPASLREQIAKLTKTAKMIYRGFSEESMNGVVCSIPDEGVDAPTHRTWCQHCKNRYLRLKQLGVDMESLLSSLSAERPTLRTAAIENVMIGGNHLASSLIAAKMMPSDYRRADYHTVLREFDQPVADIWVAWKAIMDLRDSLEAERPTRIEDEQETARQSGAEDQTKTEAARAASPQHDGG